MQAVKLEKGFWFPCMVPASTTGISIHGFRGRTTLCTNCEVEFQRGPSSHITQPQKEFMIRNECNILMFWISLSPFLDSTYLDTSLPTAAQTVSPRSLRFGWQNGWRKMYLGSQQGLWLAWEIRRSFLHASRMMDDYCILLSLNNCKSYCIYII